MYVEITLASFSWGIIYLDILRWGHWPRPRAPLIVKGWLAIKPSFYSPSPETISTLYHICFFLTSVMRTPHEASTLPRELSSQALCSYICIVSSCSHINFMTCFMLIKDRGCDKLIKRRKTHLDAARSFKLVLFGRINKRYQ